MSTETWSCNKCGAPFEPSPNDIRQYHHACRECRRANDRRYYHECGHLREHKRDRSAKRAMDRASRKSPSHRAKEAARIRERSKDPVEAHKDAVRRATRRAIASGRLIRLPCEVCGLSESHAHHDDYSKPLEVRWLCTLHHNRLHAHNRALGG